MLDLYGHCGWPEHHECMLLAFLRKTLFDTAASLTARKGRPEVHMWQTPVTFGIPKHQSHIRHAGIAAQHRR